MLKSVQKHLNKYVQLILKNGGIRSVTLIAVNNQNDELTVSEDGSITFIDLSSVQAVKALKT